MSLRLTVPNSRMFLINPTLQTNMWVIANTPNEAKNRMSTSEQTYAKKTKKVQSSERKETEPTLPVYENGHGHGGMQVMSERARETSKTKPLPKRVGKASPPLQKIHRWTDTDGNYVHLLLRVCWFALRVAIVSCVSFPYRPFLGACISQWRSFSFPRLPPKQARDISSRLFRFRFGVSLLFSSHFA